MKGLSQKSHLVRVDFRFFFRFCERYIFLIPIISYLGNAGLQGEIPTALSRFRYLGKNTQESHKFYINKFNRSLNICIFENTM